MVLLRVHQPLLVRGADWTGCFAGNRSLDSRIFANVHNIQQLRQLPRCQCMPARQSTPSLSLSACTTQRQHTGEREASGPKTLGFTGWRSQDGSRSRSQHMARHRPHGSDRELASYTYYCYYTIPVVSILTACYNKTNVTIKLMRCS